ncbi:MAG: hypothetical protein QX196_07920 [Methylococcaceae bacterium]|jgi:hypothetical protein
MTLYLRADKFFSLIIGLKRAIKCLILAGMHKSNRLQFGKINRWAESRWLSGVEAGKIASTPLSQRLNLMTLQQAVFNIDYSFRCLIKTAKRGIPD